MTAMPAWYRIGAQGTVIRRALLTALGVGTILTIANDGDEINQASMATSSILPIAVTYLVPFLAPR